MCVCFIRYRCLIQLRLIKLPPSYFMTYDVDSKV